MDPIIEFGADAIDHSIDIVSKSDLIKILSGAAELVKAFEAYKSIRDRLYLSKIEAFIHEAARISGVDRIDLMERFKKIVDSEEKQKIGETVIFLLDSYNDREKPKFMARIFVEYLKGTINYGQFKRIGNAIDIAFSDDLYLLAHEPDVGQNKVLIKGLVSTGLAEVGPGVSMNDSIVATTFVLSDIGKIFQSCFKK